jgi:HK97 family phage prohead protease
MPEVIYKSTAGFKTLNVKEPTKRSGGTIVACVSSDAVDRDLDAVIQSGIQFDTFIKTNAILLWSHLFTQPPIGRVNKLWLSPDGHRLLAEITFASHEFARSIEALYRSKMLNAFSIGFKILHATPGGREIYNSSRPDLVNKANRVVWASELLEISSVTVPSNSDAVAEVFETKGFLKNPHIRDSLCMAGSAVARKGPVATPRPVATAEGQEVSCAKCGKIRSASVCTCQDSDTAPAVAAKLASPKFVDRIVADVVGKVQGRIVARQLADQLVANVMNGVENHIAERKLDQVLDAPGGKFSGTMAAEMAKSARSSLPRECGGSSTLTDMSRSGATLTEMAANFRKESQPESPFSTQALMRRFGIQPS